MTDNQTNSNYQDILDKYAQSISSADNSQIPQEKIKPEPGPEVMTPPEPILTPEEGMLLKSQPQPELQPELELPPEPEIQPELQPQIEAPPAPEAINPPSTAEAIIPPTPQIELPPESFEPEPKKESHFFKYLFFFSLFVFIVILISVIISFINSQKPFSNSEVIPTLPVSPTDTPTAFCELNDQKYNVGESFSAADGCNICTCGDDLTIFCTEKICDPTPTKSATISAIPKDWKTYSNKEYNFSFQHPSIYKIQPLVPGGEAPMEGSFVFTSSTEGKGDSFFLDVTKFTGNLNQFIDKYTTFDSVTQQKQTILNTVSPLGDIVPQVNSKISIYKYVNHYDKKINPNAEDIISYSTFFIQDNKGFIVRSFNTKDNLIQLTQILSTFK